MTEPVPSRRERYERRMLWVSIALTVLCAGLAGWLYFYQSDSLWRLFAWLVPCLIAAIAVKSRWLIPCGIIGIFAMLSFAPTITGVSRLYQSSQWALLGFAVGAVVSMVIEYRLRVSERS
jgi:ABC-type cobalamin transport system permease subunit